MTVVRRVRELFVWYRVAVDRAMQARAEVDAMQRRLEAQCPGLRARLLTRDDGSGPQTWMETYAVGEESLAASVSPIGIDDAMRARIESAAAPLRAWIDGDRHVETFDLVDRP